jgi:hypothetical protein
MKKFDIIWKSAKPTVDIINLQYKILSRNLSKEDAHRLSTLEMHFQRGIFEQCCINYNLEKNMYKEALIYCYYKHLKSLNLGVTEDKFHQFSIECFDATQDALKYEDNIKDMTLKIHNSAKNAFKEGPGECIVVIKKIYNDKYYSFSSSPLVKSIKNFFNRF